MQPIAKLIDVASNVMKSLLKQTFCFIVLSFLLSCGQEHKPDIPVHKELTSKTIDIADSIIGERINGPANIRDKVNGEILFSLNDSTLVTCTEQQNGWYAVGLSMEIPNSDFDNDTLRKGRKIIVDGKVAGEVLKDMYVSTSTDNRKSWADLTGFTHKDNIYPYSIIENALISYMSKVSDRSIEAFQPFIRSFQMEKDEGLKPFITFFNYENWIDDSSPLLRVQLIFQENRLVGIVHSRHLELPSTVDYRLERGFRMAFFNDTPKGTKERFIKQFNQFINSVD